jgi:hypothetical protein
MVTTLYKEKAMRKILPSILTLLMLSAVASQVWSQPATSTQTFASFWVQFKAAVAKNDKEAVASMTRFPCYFEKELTRGEFIKKYNAIFDRGTQRCFTRAKPSSDYQAYLKLVKKFPKSEIPKQEDTGSYSVFCGQEIYLFEILDGKYKFTEIGAND